MSTSPVPDPPPDAPAPLRARIVLLAGPSGSGKSHLARSSGLPTVCLDDFYKDGDDPTLPIGDLGIVDWDHPDAWDGARALQTLVTLATHGTAELPVYDMTRDQTVGRRRLAIGPSRIVVAEGIFAAHLVGPCRDAGILADALCLTHRPVITFWRRLIRDLREGRKAPGVLLRRGVALLRAEPSIVAAHAALGATPVHGDGARRRLADLAADAGGTDAAGGDPPRP